MGRRNDGTFYRRAVSTQWQQLATLPARRLCTIHVRCQPIRIHLKGSPSRPRSPTLQSIAFTAQNAASSPHSIVWMYFDTDARLTIRCQRNPHDSMYGARGGCAWRWVGRVHGCCGPLWGFACVYTVPGGLGASSAQPVGVAFLSGGRCSRPSRPAISTARGSVAAVLLHMHSLSYKKRASPAAWRPPVQLPCTPPLPGHQGNHARRDYFSWVSTARGHPGKIVPGAAGALLARQHPHLPRAACPPRAPMGIPRAQISPC